MRHPQAAFAEKLWAAKFIVRAFDFGFYTKLPGCAKIEERVTGE
jgi:hypothetical protein